MTDYQRIESLLHALNFRSVRAFAVSLDVNPQIFYDIKAGKCGISRDLSRAILEKYSSINPEWLLYGEGEMLKTTTTISGDITVNGNHNSHIGHASAHCENCGGEIVSDVQELQGAPVIPTALCREGNCDILEYIEENPEEVEISPIRAKGVTIDLWYRIRASDNSN